MLPRPPSPAVRVLLVMLVCAGALAPRPASAGFCHGGVPAQTSWPGAESIVVVGSFCPGEAPTGAWSSPPFSAGRTFEIQIGGHLDRETLRLELERQRDGARRRLLVAEDPGGRGRTYFFALPGDWRNTPLRLHAADEDPGAEGWVAVAVPEATRKPADRAASVALPALLAVVYLLAVLVPGLALALAVPRRAAPPLGVVLIGAGLFAIAAFWAVYALPRIGLAAVSVAWCAALAWLLVRRAQAALLARADALWAVIGLTAAALAFYAAAGFVFGGYDEPLGTAAVRYSQPLPIDNAIPYYFYKALLAGDIPSPLVGAEQSSERPPLQTGFMLAVSLPARAAFASPEQHYQALGMALQVLWLPALWLLLRQAGVGVRATVLTVSAMLVAPVPIVHGFFVWPKLLAGAYVLCAAAFILPPVVRGARPTVADTMWSSAAAALGALAHGGALFGLLGLAALVMALRQRPGVRAVLAGCAVFAALYAPWIGYQKLADPPGDGVTRRMLAGERYHPGQSLGEAVARAYQAPVSELLANRVANVVSATGTPWQQPGLMWRLATADSFLDRGGALLQIRAAQFFRVVESLWLPLLAALLAFVSRRPARGPDALTARLLFACSAIGLVAWVLVVYGPGATQVHTGSLFFPLALLAACVLSSWARLPRFTLAWVAAYCVSQAWIYWLYPPAMLLVPDLDSAFVGTLEPNARGAANTTLTVAAGVLLLAVLGAVAWRRPGERAV